MTSGRLTFYVFTFVILYSTLQFFLLLRHKSEYLSDSYFYKHMAYQFYDNDYVQAKNTIRDQVDYTKQDKITLNIFLNDKAYDNSYTFFAKRPLYPFTVFIFNKIFNNIELAMLLPVFLSYLGTIIVFFVLASKRLNHFFTFIAVFTFVSFYPFLDWSTYYMTDTIGSLFWMAQLLAIHRYLTGRKPMWLVIFACLLLISLLNREQSMLMFLVSVITYLLLKFSKNERYIKQSYRAVMLSTGIVLGYIGLSHLTHQKNILDTIIYTMNSYGLYSKNFTLSQIVEYLLTSYKVSHVHLVKDLVSHHLWFTFFATALIGFTLYVKKMRLLDALMISSGIASYFAIYLYPVLSYRYFFPTVMTICYFSALFFAEFFRISQSFPKSRRLT